MKLHKITNNCMNECECGSECESECWSEYAAAFTCSPRLSRSVACALALKSKVQPSRFSNALLAALWPQNCAGFLNALWLNWPASYHGPPYPLPSLYQFPLLLPLFGF